MTASDLHLRPLRRALISVYDKTGLIPFARMLAARGAEILSTGGTARALREAGIQVVEVSDYTGFPEMLDGRVKTLHPKIHGGLLGIRGDADHENAMRMHDIGAIDLVAVTLYPFAETVAKGGSQEECIEQIDIGGPAMIRSAAKNHRDVLVVTDIADYAAVEEELAEHDGHSGLRLRRMLAARAFSRTASYDAAIQHWLWQQGFVDPADSDFPATLAFSAQRKQSLRYGENPHQKAAFYRTGAQASGLAAARQLQGKELSYNNLLDADAAWQLIGEFASSRPALAIIKHANPCGVGVDETLAGAYRKALASDPVSAFGGIIAVNRALDAATVEAIGTLFLEIILAPSVEEEAKALLAKKKNLRVLEMGDMTPQEAEWTLRTIAGGILVQEPDRGVYDEAELQTVTTRAPSAQEMRDMRFAFSVAKHVKSNAIVLARDEGIVGVGAGQMSRVDSTRIACWKAAEANLPTKGAVMASDAFLPFPDNVEAAARAGITAIIQPGGSVRDAEVTEAANAHGIAMVCTGLRHFRH